MADGRGERAKKPQAGNVAGAYLALLADRGVEYLFGNAGTDFAPLIEAYVQATQSGVAVPRPMLVTHENLAVAMAHGYAMLSRRIPAVMVHVSVGTANMICAAMNASRENVAILLSAGRSPLTETELLGARDGYIHWAQEMYDQAGMIREVVKWDYELRNGAQLATVVDRALSIAASEPRGPVYLSLPREVIAAPADLAPPSPSRLGVASPAAPDTDAVAAAAQLLANARRPLIVTSSAGRDPAAFAALAQFSERFAIPVVQHRPRHFSLPSSHPMSLGLDTVRLVPQADVIMVLESDVPWISSRTAPAEGCKVIQCGLDPLFTRYPIRSFPGDVVITAGARAVLSALTDALTPSLPSPAERVADARQRAYAGGGLGRLKSDSEIIADRRQWIAQERAAIAIGLQRARDAAAGKSPSDPVWVSHCIGRAKDPEAIVTNEYTLFPEHCSFEHPDLYFGSSSASGLGWGGGAALGAKLARPDKPVIAVLGDGAYMFGNPAALHHASAMHELPVLFIIMNNGMWGAVDRSMRAMYADGLAARSNAPPFVGLGPLPAFERICEAAGGWGERVDDPAALPGALERAMAVVKTEKRQALLNVICGPGGTA